MEKISRQLMNKVLDHYRDAVIQKFPNRVITPSSIIEMERYLTFYQQNMMRRETHPAWSAALKLIYDPRRAIIDVTLHENANVELV